MISVIVPVYNVEKYLNRCVDSIINQTYRDLEIILVDDGSPDNCGKICDEYAALDPRIKVIHKENGGLSDARNAGLDKATGEYIAFVDSDDWVEPETYNMMISAIQKSQSDIAIFGHRIAYEGMSPKTPCYCNDVILDVESLWDEIFGNLNNAAWNKLYKAKLIGEIRFPMGIIHGEDLIFNLNYLKKCKTGVINRSQMYNYFSRADSITKSGFSKKKILEITAKDMALEIVREVFPIQIKNAEKYCFRARMNVLRSIYKASEEGNYCDLIKEINTYINDNFKNVKQLIRFKEKVEYYLYIYFKTIYKLMTRS